MLTGVRQRLPEVMKQGPARNQYHVEIFPGSSGNMERLLCHEDAVPDILLAETRLQQYREIIFADDL